MYFVNLRSGWKLWWSILFSIMLVVAWAITPAEADHCKGKHKNDPGCDGGGGGGGGKPPKDDPVPTNPVIATWGFYKGGRELLMVMEEDGTKKQVVVGDLDGFRPRGPAWSPDGDRIAFFAGFNSPAGWVTGYYIVEMEMDDSGWTGNWLGPELLVADQTGFWAKPDWNPKFGPDQHRIAFSKLEPVVGQADIFVADFTMDGGLITVTEEVNLTKTGGVDEYSPTWSPDGERLAFIEYPANIVIYDVNNVEPPLIVDIPDESLKNAFKGGVVWAREHNLLAVEGGQGIWCVDVNDSNNVSVFNLTKNFDPSEDINAGSPSWTAGDTGIAYTGPDTIYVLEFDLPGNGCPTDADDYRSSARRRLMTDKRFTGVDWWRNAAFCGDNNLDAGEQCDDGNRVDGDGCSAVCIIEP